MFSIVFVTYNSAEVIGDAIRSVPAGNEIIVVDNASADNSVEICRTLGATVLEMPENLGFGTACNRGAAIATADSILFLNPDARLTEGALEGLASALQRYPDAVAFNPRILNEDGSQFLRRRTVLLPRPYLFFRPPPPTGDEPIIMATGAALLVRRKDFEDVGGFDENIFLYYEDDDLSARFVKAGRSMRYVHDAVVRHKGRSSSGPADELNPFRDYHMTKSQIYVCRKHGIFFSTSRRILREKLRYYRAKCRGDRARANSISSRLRALDEAL